MKKNTAKDFLDLYFDVKNRYRKDAIYSADYDIADHYGYIYNGDTDLRDIYEEYKFYTHEANPDVADLFAAIQDEAEKYRKADYKRQEGIAQRLIQEVQDGKRDGLCRSYYESLVLERRPRPFSIRPEEAVRDYFHNHLLFDEHLRERVKIAMLRYHDAIYQTELKELALQEQEEQAERLAEEKEKRERWKRNAEERERQRNFWR